MHEQSAALEAALRENHVARAVLAVAADLDLPDWYFGAGGVAQTVWNLLHRWEPSVGIKDYDLVYFDGTDLGVEAERQVEAEVADRLSDLGIVVDVKNEARVPLWYELADVFEMVARPNKTIVTRDVYGEKVTRWATRWPQPTVIPW